MNEMHEMQAMMHRLKARREQADREARFDLRRPGRYVKRDSRNRWIREHALVIEPLGRNGEAELWITYRSGRDEALRNREQLPELARLLLDPDALNGYVAFPKRRAPRIPPDCLLVKFIPVHGGVSYRCKDSVAAVWGFDTLHAGSEDTPRTDPAYIRGECFKLYTGLLIAEEMWPRYRREPNRQTRAEMLEALVKTDITAEGPLSQRLGFEAMISVITGEL